MREFIVTNPNLSVGKPGDVVTAEQLRMSDEKLDEWVHAGHGVEMFTVPDDPEPFGWTEVVPEEPLDAASGIRLTPHGAKYFNPADFNVQQVKAYMDENPEFAEQVRSHEIDGKNRSTIVDYQVG